MAGTQTQADGLVIDRRAWLVVGAAVVAGVVLRVWILTHALGVLDSDEAVTGLVARHFVHTSEHPVFYWASNYGGTLEALVTAGPFALLGSSVTLLKLISVAWDAAGAVLVWRIGRRLVGEPGGAFAGAIFWVWPATYVWWSTKSRGFYGALLVCGLVTLLCALRLAEEPRRPLDWLVLGLAFGLGWWTGPQIVFLAVPAFGWILLRNWRALRWAPLGLPTAVLGAAPWLEWNLRHHFDSFHNPPLAKSESYPAHLLRFGREGLPVALGLRVPYSLRWITSHLGPALYAAAVVVLVALVVRRFDGNALLLALAVAAYPFLYALSPFSAITSEGRYLFLLAPLVALIIGRGLRSPAVAAVVLGGLVLLTAGGLSAMPGGNSPYASDRPVPISMGGLVPALRSHGISTAFADYWIAYRLDFESAETVTATPTANVRYAADDSIVRSSPDPAWIFVAGSAADRSFVASLAAHGVAEQSWRAGGFDVVLPGQRVLPGDPAAGP